MPRGELIAAIVGDGGTERTSRRVGVGADEKGASVYESMDTDEGDTVGNVGVVGELSDVELRRTSVRTCRG